MKNKTQLLLLSLVISFTIFSITSGTGNILSSEIRNGETIFNNICASCHVRNGKVIQSGIKSLSFSDLEERNLANTEAIIEIANEGIGYMKGYKNNLSDGEDRILAEWIIENAKEGWLDNSYK